ncbi:hypothetical protein M2266_003128 [Streptomyces sp. SPB162]|nr:hypothetical protein [Streptomyces sp. SPB162]
MERPGGKGLNVARVLAALGHDTVVTGFAGGRTGEVLRERLAALGTVGDTLTPRHGTVRDALVPIEGATRRTVGVVDDATGDATLFNEAGPTVGAAEWAAFLTGYRELPAGGLGRRPVRQSAARAARGLVRGADPRGPHRGRPRSAGHQWRAAAPRPRRAPRPDQAQPRRADAAHRLHGARPRRRGGPQTRRQGP